MRNRKVRHYYTFIGWHCKEVFGIPIESRNKYYQPTSELWSASVELLSVYPTPSPWLYQYFWTYKNRVGSVDSCFLAQYDAINIHEYSWLSVPVIVGVGSHGTYRRDYRGDPRLGADSSKMKIPVIAPLSAQVAFVIDHLGIISLIYNFQDATRVLLLFRWQREIDWDATFAEKLLGDVGRYLTYNFQTGEVGCLAACQGSVGMTPCELGEVSPVLRRVNFSTVETCQAETDKYKARLRAEKEAQFVVPPEVQELFREDGRSAPTAYAEMAGSFRAVLGIGAMESRLASELAVQLQKERLSHRQFQADLAKVREKSDELESERDELILKVSKIDKEFAETKEQLAKATAEGEKVQAEFDALTVKHAAVADLGEVVAELEKDLALMKTDRDAILQRAKGLKALSRTRFECVRNFVGEFNKIRDDPSDALRILHGGPAQATGVETNMSANPQPAPEASIDNGGDKSDTSRYGGRDGLGGRRGSLIPRRSEQRPAKSSDSSRMSIG